MGENKPTIFKYGQVLVSKKETVLEGFLTGKKTVVPKGNRIVVGFDGFAHHLNGGYIQPFGEDVRLEGFSSSGIVYSATFLSRKCARTMKLIRTISGKNLYMPWMKLGFVKTRRDNI